MKTVKLIRTFKTEKQCLGTFIVTSEAGIVFVCKTLELGDKKNQPQISCISAGKYVCKFTRSPHLSAEHGREIWTYEIFNVPDRAGIRIHAANFYFQLLGCVALGAAHKDINADQELDVIHSGNTCQEFENLMERKDFIIEIVNLFD